MAKPVPKHICIDARFYRRATAGVGRYTRGLIHSLQKIDPVNHYTVILTPADYAEWPKDTTPKNWTVKVMDIPIYSLAEQTELLRYLNDQKFDLVHFAMFNHPVRYKGKSVVTIHDLIMHLFPLRPLWHPRTWAYRYVMWHAAQRATRVIAPSQSTKHDIETMLHAPAPKIDVVLEAIEPEFKPLTNEKLFDTLRQKYGLTKPFLFYINAWRPHKGLPELVEAFLKAKSKTDIQLLIAGKPNPAFPEVIAAVENGKQQSADIITPGFISDEDMITLYSMATAFVLPTHYEGFGIPPLEAITCGCPVISAKNSSLPEVLGEAAIYYPTGDSEALSQSMIKVTTDPALRDTLRQKGFTQAKHFSFRKMAKETLEIYQKALHQ